MDKQTLLSRLNSVEKMIGRTPLIALEHPVIDLRLKLEYFNWSGHLKDRVAYAIVKRAIETGKINVKSTLIESSAGGLALSLALLCNRLGLPFVAVIDPTTPAVIQLALQKVAKEIVVVTQPDDRGGYLISGLKKIHELCSRHPEYFWTNQYGNHANFEAHYYGTGREFSEAFDRLDYLFVGVSSGGALAGISRRLKEAFPKLRVVAVDVEGSVIFGGQPARRFLPGMGSSLVPQHIGSALVDEVVYVSDPEIVEGCHELLSRHSVFAGGSTGAVYFAIQRYFAKHKPSKPKPIVAFLAPDRGTVYADTIFNAEWVAKLKRQTEERGIVMAVPRQFA